MVKTTGLPKQLTLQSYLPYFSSSYHLPSPHLFVQSLQSTSRICEIWLKLTKRQQNDAINVASVSLLLTLNRFYTLFCCFHCLLLAGYITSTWKPTLFPSSNQLLSVQDQLILQEIYTTRILTYSRKKRPWHNHFDTGRQLNVGIMFKRRPKLLLSVLCTSNVLPVPRVKF